MKREVKSFLIIFSPLVCLDFDTRDNTRTNAHRKFILVPFFFTKNLFLTSELPVGKNAENYKNAESLYRYRAFEHM